MTDQDILFRLDVDASGAVQGFRLSRDELTKLRQASEQTGAGAKQGAAGVKQLGDETEKTGQKAATTSDAMRRLQGLVAGIFTIATVRQAIQYADTMNLIDARIRIVTDTTEEFNRAQQGVFDIAQRTATSLEATAQLYTRLELALKNTSTSQEDVLRVTEAVNKSLSISGATAQETSSAVIQLGQALGRGALSGEEFRTVAEASPRILIALQDALGKTQGELKELADAQMLTTEIVVQALLEQSEAISTEYAEIPVTVGRAFTMLRNEVLVYVADADDATEASAKLAAGIVTLSENLDTVANVGLAVASAALVIYTGRMITAIATTAQAGTVIAALGGPLTIVAGLVAALTFAYLENTARAKELAGAMDLASGSADRFANSIKTALNVSDLADELEEVKEAFSTIEAQIIEVQDRIAKAQSVKGVGNRDGGIATIGLQKQLEDLLAAQAELQEQYNALRAKQRELNEEAGKTAPIFTQTKTAAELLAESMGDLEAETKKVEAAMKTANKLIAEHGTVSQKVEQLDREYNATLAEMTAQLSKTADGKRILAAATEALKKAHTEERQALVDSVDAVKTLQEALNELEREAADPLETKLLQLELQLEEVANQFGETSPEVLALQERIHQLRLQLDEVPDAAKAAAASVSSLQTAINRGIERLDDLGANLWKSWITGTQSAMDAIKDYVLNTFAEIAHAAITRPIVLQIAAAIGGTGANSAFASLGGSAAAGAATGAGGISGAISGIGALFNGSGIGLALQNLPTWAGGVSNGISSSGAWAPFGNAAAVPNWGYGLAALGGGFLGDKLFGGYGGVGGSAGATIGTALGAAGGPIGMILGGALGTLVGGFIGGLFGQDKAPVLDASGYSQANQSGSDDDSFFNSDLGGVFTRSRRIDGSTVNEFGQKIAEFDNLIAGFLDSDELSAATDRLKTWELHLEGSAITLEEYLGSRLSVVLGTLSDEAQAFVNRAGDLEGKVENLAIITATEKLIELMPELFGGLTETADLLLGMAKEGEGVGDTFARVVASIELVSAAFDTMNQALGHTGEDLIRFATDFTDAAGSVQRGAELWGKYFNTFYDANELAERQLSAARGDLGTKLGAIGLTPNIDGAQFREIFETVLPTLSAEALAKWLEAAEALGLVINMENQLTAARLQGLDIEDALRVQTQLTLDLRNAYDGSAESMRGVVSAGQTLEVIMSALEDAFDQARASVDSITGGAINDLRRETLSPEQLFNELRDQALSKANLLQGADSRSEVISLTNEITQLVRDARGVLDNTDSNAGFIAFLEDINETANLRLGELEETALLNAQAQLDANEAMLTFATAAEAFAAAVDVFTGGDIVLPSAGDDAAGPGAVVDTGITDAIATGFTDGFSGFSQSVTELTGGMASLAAAAQSFSRQAPNVYVDVQVLVDPQGNVTRNTEVSLA